jgi:hypothetical protein
LISNGDSIALIRTIEQMQPVASAAPVFRFKLSDSMVDALLQFSKTHQNDDRETYKDAWIFWKRDSAITAAFENESKRLKMLGYRGSEESIEDKIFKSGRYYFRNKSFIKAPPTKRCKYIPMSKELITAMDNHIITNAPNTPPALLFVNFCQKHVDVVNDEMARLCNPILVEREGREGSCEPSIISKIKKTYKNRVFKMNSQHNLLNAGITC